MNTPFSTSLPLKKEAVISKEELEAIRIRDNKFIKDNEVIAREIRKKYKELMLAEESDVQKWWAFSATVDDRLRRLVVKKMFDASDRIKKYKNSPLFRNKIRKYCNLHLPNDAFAYEVVKVISPITVEIRALDTKQTVFPKDFHPGGFVGHYADNYAQDYEYTSNEKNSIVRIRLGKRGWGGGHYHMSDYPNYFHDYNL